MIRLMAWNLRLNDVEVLVTADAQRAEAWKALKWNDGYSVASSY